ncbi:MAG: PRC-barrel domain-containing protein [Bacteroidota bacterium]
MSYKTGILLGRVTKVKGYEGTVTIRLERSFTEEIPELNPVFLEIEGKPVPFFTTEPDNAGNGLLRLKLEGCESIKGLNEFAGCRVFLDAGKGEPDQGNNLSSITGFKVLTKDKSLAGTVREIIAYPGQWLMIVTTEAGSELLIPLHEDLIIKVDKKKKMILMDLPEGLMEI